jgi:dTDP-4-amino-4,6-dideoxygalactose transaminase
MRALLVFLLASLLAAGAVHGAEVESFSPQGEAKAVRQAAALFESPMVAFGDPRLSDPFEVECPVPGSGRWVDARRWVWDFERDLPGGLRCSFRVREGLATLAGERRVSVVEDAAHAIGSEYVSGGRVGNGRFSSMTVFSFHPVKSMTTGEGGAITTNDPALYEALMMLRSHGITRDPARLADAPGAWWYEQQMLGFNYRMTDIQAALGGSQLRKLDRFRDRRLAIIARYRAGLSDLAWLNLPPDTGTQTVCWHLFVARFDFEAIGRTRAEVMAALAGEGVGSQVHYIPVYRQPWYVARQGDRSGRFPDNEAWYARCLSLPLYPAMTDEDADRVIAAVRGLG